MSLKNIKLLSLAFLAFVFTFALGGLYLLADDHEPYLTELPEWYNVNEEGKWECNTQSIGGWSPYKRGVKRVVGYIVHEMVGNSPEVPEILHLDHLKSKLLSRLQHRFTTYGGRVKQTFKPGCYGRADQPISIYTNEDEADFDKFKKELVKPGTLGVVIIIRVRPDHTGSRTDPKAFLVAIHRHWIRKDLESTGKSYDTGNLSIMIYRLDHPNGDRDLKLFINKYF